MAEHTPTPWHVATEEWGDGPIYSLRHETDDAVVYALGDIFSYDVTQEIGASLPGKSNAEHIVRCVNSFDEMVASLKAIRDSLHLMKTASVFADQSVGFRATIMGCASVADTALAESGES